MPDPKVQTPALTSGYYEVLREPGGRVVLSPRQRPPRLVVRGAWGLVLGFAAIGSVPILKIALPYSVLAAAAMVVALVMFCGMMGHWGLGVLAWEHTLEQRRGPLLEYEPASGLVRLPRSGAALALSGLNCVAWLDRTTVTRIDDESTEMLFTRDILLVEEGRDSHLVLRVLRVPGFGRSALAETLAEGLGVRAVRWESERITKP